MRCALVFYLVVTISFVVQVYSSLPELCEINVEMNEGKRASCGIFNVQYRFDFIPPVSQNISGISLWGQPLKQLPYNAFRNLTSQSSISRISLLSCQINHVDAGALLNLHNLTSIDMSLNDITQIDSMLFSDTKLIKYIYMTHNKIAVLPSGIFRNLPLLEAVYIDNNRIHRVERISFKDTPSLRILNLNNNQIEYMNVSFKNKFDNFTTLRLYGNPWKCNCELGPIFELLTKINRLDQPGLVCENPAALQGRKWSDISKDKFVCRSEDAISTQDSVMTSTEQTTTIEADDNIPVTVYSGTTLPTIVRRSHRRTNAHNMDSGLPIRVIQSGAVSEHGDSGSKLGDVDKK